MFIRSQFRILRKPETDAQKVCQKWIAFCLQVFASFIFLLIQVQWSIFSIGFNILIFIIVLFECEAFLRWLVHRFLHLVFWEHRHTYLVNHSGRPRGFINKGPSFSFSSFLNSFGTFSCRGLILFLFLLLYWMYIKNIVLGSPIGLLTSCFKVIRILIGIFLLPKEAFCRS